MLVTPCLFVSQNGLCKANPQPQPKAKERKNKNNECGWGLVRRGRGWVRIQAKSVQIRMGSHPRRIHMDWLGSAQMQACACLGKRPCPRKQGPASTGTGFYCIYIILSHTNSRIEMKPFLKKKNNKKNTFVLHLTEIINVILQLQINTQKK
jgi:hypothetical protein